MSILLFMEEIQISHWDFWGKGEPILNVKNKYSIHINPIGSMYGIFSYIWLICMVNVGKYTIHIHTWILWELLHEFNWIHTTWTTCKNYPTWPLPSRSDLDQTWFPAYRHIIVTTVDGLNPANQLKLVVYPIIYRVLAPSQVVVWDFSHQQ